MTLALNATIHDEICGRLLSARIAPSVLMAKTYLLYFCFFFLLIVTTRYENKYYMKAVYIGIFMAIRVASCMYVLAQP
jgi:hypothetical protein